MSFYHRSTLVHRNQGEIHMLKIDGEWNSNTKEIADQISNFSSHLFDRVQLDSEETEFEFGGQKLDIMQANRLIIR